ncbi:MAG: hypothetical protein V4667_13745 [Bacteroidota bacterium]
MYKLLFVLLFINSISFAQKDSTSAKFSASLLVFPHSRHEINGFNDTTVVGYTFEKNISSNISFKIYKNFNAGVKLFAVKFKQEYYSGTTTIVNGYLTGPFLSFSHNKTTSSIYASARVSYLFGNFIIADDSYYHFIAFNRNNTNYIALDLELGLKLHQNISAILGLNFSKTFVKNTYANNYGTIGIMYSFYGKKQKSKTVFKSVRNL